MKQLFFTFLVLLFPYSMAAQDSDTAKEILDKVISTFKKDGSVQIDFDGTEHGSIIIKEEKFYLHSGQMQCWYDGNTLWSYVADTEEVNISTPTHEELLSVNPYLILSNYQTNFNCLYQGLTEHHGKQVYEITLVPRQNGNKEKITIKISKSHYPVSIKVEQNHKMVSEINIKSYQKQQINDMVFRFNKSLYPNAEIIDLR